MRTKLAVLAVFSACVVGYFTLSPSHTPVIPADLRDAVKDSPLNSLKAAAGDDAADINIPEPKAGSTSTEISAEQDSWLGRKLDLPVFFALPESAMLPNIYALTEFHPPNSVPRTQMPANIKSAPRSGLAGEARMRDPNIPGYSEKAAGQSEDQDAANASPFIYSIHPEHPVGYHVAVVSRAEAAKKLAESGMVQTGDIILTVRPEWGFRGSYPNLMMGISHAGFAFVYDGLVYNLDHPLGPEYCGNFNSDHYKNTTVLHVIRPRNLTQKQKQNLNALAKKLYDTLPMSGQELVPGEINFNTEYTEPTYTSNPGFAKIIAQVAWGYKNEGLNIYCSEFVWGLMALKNCDSKADAAGFAGEGVPACMSEPFKPIPVLGDYALNPRSPAARLGFFDGPLSVINSMGLSREEKAALIRVVFQKLRPKDTDSESVYSEGPTFDKVENYYAGVENKSPQVPELISRYNKYFQPNYPPVAFVLNALLPTDSPERVMDVVGTVVFSD